MKIKKTLCLLSFFIAIASVSCTKHPSDITGGDYLRFGRATLNVLNRHGSNATVSIESNVDWSLSIENPAPDWLTINKFLGSGNDSLTVLAIKDNNTNGYKYANVFATPINNNSLLPVKLTIVQYDSTYKGK